MILGEHVWILLRQQFFLKRSFFYVIQSWCLPISMCLLIFMTKRNIIASFFVISLGVCIFAWFDAYRNSQEPWSCRNGQYN